MMASKRPLFGRKRHADPEERVPFGVREPANQSNPREPGAQRGVAYDDDFSPPGGSDYEVDLLGDDGGRQSGGWRFGVAIVAALFVFAGGLWYAYEWGIEQLGTTRLPTILADTTPIKSRPENPGGIEVLNQDVAVLNDAAPGPGQPQAERLLPPPETPQVAQTEPPPTMSAAELEKLLGPPQETAAGPLVEMPEVAVAQPPIDPPAAPPIELPAAPPIAPQIAAASSPEAVPAPALPEPSAEPLAAPAAAPVAATEEPAPQVAALPEPQTGDFVVQLAALRARDRARLAWTRLQSAHPALLGDRELAVQQVDLGDRGIFYRVQAGFFADRAGAGDLCNALKARGQDCLVVKR